MSMQVLQTLHYFTKYSAYFLLRNRFLNFATRLNLIKQAISIQIVCEDIRFFLGRTKSIFLNSQFRVVFNLSKIGMTKCSPLFHHFGKILLLVNFNRYSFIYKFGSFIDHDPSAILGQKIFLHIVTPRGYLVLLSCQRISHNLISVYILMAICEKINLLVVSFTIFLATLWFVLVVQLSNPVPNSNKEKGDFKREGSQVELLTIPLHKAAENYDSLELIELINNSQPYNVGVEAVLLVTSEWWGKDYQNFMQLLTNSRASDNFQVPLYMLKQTKNFNYYNHRTLKAHSRNMLHLFKHCIEAQSIKRLSILAYEEGALLTLLALSDANHSLLQNIDKVILINAFNPDHQLFQNDPKSVANLIKRNILSDPRRTTMFNKLRIVIINTFRTIYPQQPEVRQYFNFAFQDTLGLFYQLNSTLSLSSKAMWNVHCTLQIHQYFRYEPFLSLLLRLFLSDHKQKLSMKEIEYLLRYRELREAKVMSESTRKRYLSSCQFLHLQTLSLEINSIKLYKDCTTITIRQRYYYNEAILVFFSDSRFDLYSQQYYKIAPYSSKQGQYIYVITNLKDVSHLTIINPSKKGIGFKITSLYTAVDNPITFLNQDANDHKTLMIQDQETILVIQSCQGWRPVFGLGNNENYKQIMQLSAGNCFIQLQQRHIYPAWFRYNWNIVRNLIIFTLFSTHIINKLTFNRFYTQLVLNLVILSYTLNHLYLFQSMIITSTSTAIELLSKGITKVSSGLSLGGSYSWLIVILPALLEFIARQYGEASYMNLQKILWIQVMWVNSQSGFLITIIKCYFMHDIYGTNSASIYSLILLALWQINNIKGISVHRNSQLAISKRRMTDIIFLFMLCMSLSEEASVIHQLMNFYMITHLLLAAGQMANVLMDHT